MLSYQHGYHAGNFADVVKHLTLTRLLNYLVIKDKPLFYLETHSGRGIYDLLDNQAIKTGEYLQGIALLWEKKRTLSPLFATYLQCLNKINPTNELRYYPGSPQLIISQLRQQDRAIFSELHPREFEQLLKLPTQGKKVHYSFADGLKNLTALLPPPEKRGLIFIDPSYEVNDEYKHIPQSIQAATNRFSAGVYCLWYPIVDQWLHGKLLQGLANIHSPKRLRIEFLLNRAQQTGLIGCGLWIINPPYTLAAEMKTILTALTTIFNPKTSTFLIE